MGDLVSFSQTLEWEGITAQKDEIGIVIQIFDPNDEENYFDLKIQLGDGLTIPVWFAEVELIK